MLRGAPGSAHYRWQLAAGSRQLADVLAQAGRSKEALACAQGLPGLRFGEQLDAEQLDSGSTPSSELR